MPQDLPRPRAVRRGRVWLVVAAVLVVIVLLSLRGLATLWTDYLWFGSVHFAEVWRRLLYVKVELVLAFALVFFVVLWANLAVVDRLAPAAAGLGPEDELVRRYQRVVAPRALWVRTVVSLVLALIAASGTAGQWQNYLLFVNGVSFGRTDPQFHRDLGFYVFKLPFLQFLVSWAFVSLVVITLVTLVAHYLTGGVRVQSGAPRVAPQVKAHLSVLLALIAVVKFFGYLLQRYSLVNAGDGYRQGAMYTDVHARLPALTLLMWLSLAAVVLLVVNIYRQGWALPVLAVGLWAFVALVIGTIYPAIIQALKVNPAQNQLEAPYIARNIAATRQAMDLTNVKIEPFAADASLTTAELNANAETLNAVRLWDPELTGPTYTKQQAFRSYYSFNTLSMDRYDVNGVETPTVVGVRQVNDSDLPAQGWVNVHLQYTHGYGMIVSPANQSTTSGEPEFAVSNVPPVSSQSLPEVSQPSVYFGVANPSGGDADYVVADTRQAEIDYERGSSGAPQESHYSGSGGVKLSNFFVKAAFAVRFGDLNLLISDRLTPQSRLMFVRDVTQMAEKAAPFLSFDADPYPVLVNGQIDWVLDGYTTTDNYPYAQNADTSALSSASGLQQTFNYVRNSVKVVVNAYTGKMTFYVTAQGRTDPILRTWERAFPHMFTTTPMPAQLVDHLRYPEDMFTVQAAAFGRYHITNPTAFYLAGDAWNLSQDPGEGPPQQALATTFTTNAQGQTVSTGQVQRMSPLYEELALPGQSSLSFNLMDAFVPVSNGDQIQTLAGFMTAGCDPGTYGQLTVYETPRNVGTDGPALIDSRIQQNQTVSRAISLLNQTNGGSGVLLGNVIMVPVGQSMLYFRPLYVSSSRNPAPQLQDVIAVYSTPNGGSQVAMEPTLAAALNDVFTGVALPTTPSQATTPPTSGTTPAANQQVRNLINQANTDFANAQKDFQAGNFAQYGSDIASLQQVLQQLQQDSGTQSGSGSGSTASTTTTTAGTTTTTGVADRRR